MSELGFLGLGTMGAGMARRLVDAGHTVRVWNRSAAAAEGLVAAGAVLVSTPAEALAQPVSFSMLANDTAAESVLAPSGTGIHVNMASISGALADRLQQRFEAASATYVAAPVLGRPAVAAAGNLNILAAGPADAITAVSEYLDVLGAKTWHFGERPRQANVVKIAVNYNLIHAIEAIGESVALVERHDVAAQEFVDLLTSTLFDGVAYTGYGNIIATQAYDPPGFTVSLGLKDLALAEEVAVEGGVTLPTAPALRAVFERTLAEPDLADLDWGAIAEVSRRDLS